MPGQKISTLQAVTDLRPTDQFPLTRNGTTFKILGDKFASKADFDTLGLALKSKVVAWVKFKANETIGNQTVIAGLNVSTVYKQSVGNFRIDLTNPLNSADYSVTAICKSTVLGQGTIQSAAWVQVAQETRLDGLDIIVYGPQSSGLSNIVPKDVDWVTLQIVL